MQTKLIKYVSIITFFIICGIWYVVTSQKQPEETILVKEEPAVQLADNIEISKNPKEDFKEKIVIHVCGAVKSPGIYELDEGSRIYEAIAKAGGVLENAAAEQLNQAAKISDGQQLYVPFQGETNVFTGSQESSSKETGVNINTANKEELMTLPGIGVSKAEAIIKYREEHGDFKDVQELTNIAGIKTSVYEKIKELVRVR